MEEMEADSVMTYIPTYEALRSELYAYDRKLARKLSLRARFVMRGVSSLNKFDNNSRFYPRGATTSNSLLPLVRLFATRSDLFYPLMKDWIRWCKAIEQNEKPRNLSYHTRGHSKPTPRHLMSYFHNRFFDLTSNNFNLAVAKALGIPQTIADAMMTERTNEPHNMTVLALYCFHLPLSTQAVSEASKLFDIYTTRVITSDASDTLYYWTSDEQHYSLSSAFTSSGLNDSSVLSWLVVQAITNISNEQVVSVASQGFKPLDFMERWGLGMDADIAAASLTNDIDSDLLGSLGADFTPRIVEYRPWYGYLVSKNTGSMGLACAHCESFV